MSLGRYNARRYNSPHAKPCPLVGSPFLGVALILLFDGNFLVPSGAMWRHWASSVAVAGKVIMLFEVSTTLGLIRAIASLLGLPFLLFFMLRLWPNTPIGRILLLRNPPPRSSTPLNQINAASVDAAVADSPLTVGMTGKTISELRPGGICSIGGRRVDCLAEGGVIRAGVTIRISSIDGMHVKVRPADDV